MDEVALARERLALEHADRVSATPVDVPDDSFARLAAELSEREIVEPTATIAHENYNSKFNRPADRSEQLLHDSATLARGAVSEEEPMSDPEATHDRLGADILSAHERLTRTIEARLPAMPSTNASAISRCSRRYRQARGDREAVAAGLPRSGAELLPILMQRFSSR